MRDSSAVGPYRIETPLGQGGMGEVFRGRHRRLGRSVALKRIRPEKAGDPRARARFLKEARIAARLQDPSLVSVHDILEDGETLWLVMELVEGQSLDRWLQQGPPPLDLGIRLALDMASGLAAIHGGGILHRDLASKNVMVASPKPERGESVPRAKLLDFGLAKVWSEAGASSTGTGGPMGTPRAMSPEQARGERLDARSDLFSLGALLHELFLGVPPFAAGSALETLGRVCHHEPDPLRHHRPEVPETLDRWVSRLLAKEAAERPRSARDVAIALEGLLRMDSDPRQPAQGKRSVSTGPTAPGRFPRGRPPESGAGLEGRGERRQLTVVCGELVGRDLGREGSSGGLEPETLLQVLPPFHARLHRVLERYGGHLGELSGHRFEVYFGWPHAQGDGVPRALSAALELASSGEELRDPRPQPTGLAVRVGVHTGPVQVAVDPKGRQRLVLGETWERAAELRSVAAPGHVWASDAVGQFQSEFALEEVGPAEALAQRGGAVRVRPAVAPGNEAPTFASAAGPAVPAPRSPMVGRVRELNLLRERLRQAAEGTGGAVSIIAKAGLGKTRLLQALEEEPEMDAGFQIARGSSFRPRHALAPVAEITHRLLGLGGAESAARSIPETVWDARLSNALDAYDLPSEYLLSTLGPWLRPGRDDVRDAMTAVPRAAIQLGPELLLELVAQRFETEGPSVLIFEDLQWVAPATLEIIGTLIERLSMSPLLLVLTARPGFQTPWGHRRSLTDLRLWPLDHKESLALLDHLESRENVLPPANQGRRRELVERSAGNPRYIEALSRAARFPSLEFPSSGVPASLFDELMAKLDRLGTARDLARIAALAPETWSEDDLLRWHPMDPVQLDHEIGRLVDAEIWAQAEGGSASRSWTFADSMLREVAVATWGEADRMELQRALVRRPPR
ncbi:MAG: protein kinase [Acidobacteriota bacterium]